MPYVNVPNDLSKIKTKLAFNLTKRQLICFGGGAAIGIPAYLAELDEAVTRVCRTWFPEVSSGYEDSRVVLCYGDGVKFVEGKQEQYDLILVDSTDPVGPGEGLFSRAFYQNCCRALKKDGILVNQHESPYYPGDRRGMLRAHRYLKEIFPFASVYQFHMPSYASGLWLFGLASKGKADPEEINEERWEKRNIKTGYYNPKIHRASFALPEFVWDMLGGKEPEGWRLL